jgi:hypothetical protein
MSTVVANMSTSLDGFIEDRAGGVGHLFAWYASRPAGDPTCALRHEAQFRFLVMKDQRFVSASRLLTNPPAEPGLPSSLGRHAAH